MQCVSDDMPLLFSWGMSERQVGGEREIGASYFSAGNKIAILLEISLFFISLRRHIDGQVSV